MPPSSRNAESRLAAAWRSRGFLAVLLLPIALVFSCLVRIRRQLYRFGWMRSERLPVPVIVVGNVTVGGAGKTPLVLALAQTLTALGRHPGLLSRGYGASIGEVREVAVESAADQVGDEPLLLKRRFGGPVFVGQRRAAAGRALLAAYPRCDVLICDDGLQHYALARDLEIAVVDRRGLMNGWPLPAGPLREPQQRLAEVDAVVLNDSADLTIRCRRVFHMSLLGMRFYRLDDPGCACHANELAGLCLHAVAGIGEPQRFFDTLTALRLDFTPHAFPDHHRYTIADLAFEGDAILATEKDAVKLHGLTALPVWVLPVEARLEPDLGRFLLEKLDGFPPA